MLGMLTEPETLPILFHCSGGRDRTGVTVAIALGAANGQLERLLGDVDVPRDEVARALTTHPATMLALLERVRREHGGFDELYRSWGVSEDKLSDARARYCSSSRAQGHSLDGSRLMLRANEALPQGIDHRT